MFKRLMIEMKVTFDNISNNLQFRVARERYLSAQHDVENNAQRPNVNFMGVFL